MKKIFSLSSLILLFVFSQAQIRIESDGDIGIGTGSPTADIDIDAPNVRIEASAKLEIDMPATGIDLIGEEIYYEGSGFYPSSTGNIFLGYNSKRFGKVHAVSIYANGIYLGSDIKLKTNIKDLDRTWSLHIINQLKPKKYDLLPVAQEGIEKTIQVNLGKDQFGLIAQDIAEILPSLVAVEGQGKDATLYINSNNLITIIISAIQELNAKIDNNNGNLKSTQLLSVQENYREVGFLEQNIPNPFSEQTKINYILPQNSTINKLFIYNSRGSLVKETNLLNNSNSVIINGNTLIPGTYFYTLVSDEVAVDTKTMLITD